MNKITYDETGFLNNELPTSFNDLLKAWILKHKDKIHKVYYIYQTGKIGIFVTNTEDVWDDDLEDAISEFIFSYPGNNLDMMMCPEQMAQNLKLDLFRD